MKKRILVVSALIILIVGIYQYIKVPSKPPTLTATVNDKNIQVFQGTYCWGGTCADMKYPENLIAGVEAVKIKSGDKIKLKFSYKNPTTIRASIYSSNNDFKDIKVENYIVDVPKERGIYNYYISGFWQKGANKNAGLGSSDYVFKVKVE